MGLCFYQNKLRFRQTKLRLNPLVMGLCFYLNVYSALDYVVGLNPLVMGLCFYLKMKLKDVKVGQS